MALLTRPIESANVLAMSDAGLKHFIAVAHVLGDDARSRREEARKIDPVTRMSLGLRLAREIPSSTAAEAELDRRARGQADLHRRWLEISRRRP